MSKKAYMIGQGIGMLSASAFLILDAGWKGEQITLYGVDKHGANDGADAEDFSDDYYGNKALEHTGGFLARGGRMLNEPTYEHLWYLFKQIPSLDHPDKSVTDEILDFDHAHPTNDISRLIDKKHGIRNKNDRFNTKHMQFNNKDRMLLTKLMMLPEKDEEQLNNITIKEWFKNSPHIFTTNFWYMWETTFAFKPEHSAMELRRYMNRMILEFSRINTLEGVTRTPYNQYESLILPLRTWLEGQGVNFVNNTAVIDWDFVDTPLQDDIIVKSLTIKDVNTNEETLVDVDEDDLVFDTNGSITDSSTIGSWDKAPTEDMSYGVSASLWKKASNKFYNVGNPDKFFDDRASSEWTSYTITCNNHDLLNEIVRITGQKPGNALQTWVDSKGLMSIVVHHQPHFHAQKPNETVLWGYFLHPREQGEFVDKPIIEFTGEDVFEELIGHLNEIDPEHKILARKEELKQHVVNSIPVYMPYASALFNNRAKSDRPEVVPEHSKNLAFVSQFVEIPVQMTFTEMLTIESAMFGVYKLLGMDTSKVLNMLNRYEKDPKVLAKATKTMFR